MSLIMKNMWRNVLRGSSLSRSMTPRSLCSVSELSKSQPDPVMKSLQHAGRTDDILTVVQLHLPQMTHTHLLQALRSLLELHKAGDLPEDTDSLLKDPTFTLLCQNFKKYARELQVNETIEAIKVLSLLKVPVDSLIVQTLLQIIRCKINELNIRNIMFTDFILSRFDKQNHLVDALKLALPLSFQINMSNQLDHEDLPLLKDMLAYACHRDLPDKVINNIVTGLLLHDQGIDAQTAKSIIWSLCQVNCTEDRYPTRLQLLHICYEILALKVDRLKYDDVLKTAAMMKGRILEKHPEFYHEQLMDAMAEYVVKHDVPFEKGLLIARLLSRIAHTNLTLIEHLCTLASTHNTLSTARTTIIFGFINCLANNNYTPQPDQWSEIKKQIACNPVLDGSSAALPWVKLCLEMASLGCYEDKLLAKVFSPAYLEEYLTHSKLLDYLQLLTLHTAVQSFHTDRYTLPREVIEKAKSLYPVNPVNELMEKYMVKGLGGAEFVVRNVVLSCGITADLVTCIKGGYPVKLSVASSDDKVPVEHLNLPQDAIIVAVVNFNAGCFSMNSNRLRGPFRLILDIIDKQGYMAVPINVTEWLAAPDHERTPYLMREIGYKCGEMAVKLAGT